MRGVGGATTGTQVAGKERGLCGLRRSGDAKQRGQMGLPRAVSCGVRSVPFSAPSPDICVGCPDHVQGSAGHWSMPAGSQESVSRGLTAQVGWPPLQWHRAPGLRSHGRKPAKTSLAAGQLGVGAKGNIPSWPAT